MNYRFLFLFFTLLSIIVNGYGQQATNELLHQKFQFTANRKINLREDISHIDRVIQTENIIFFLSAKNSFQNNEEINDITVPKEYEKAILKAGEILEKHLNINYTIPVFVHTGGICVQVTGSEEEYIDMYLTNNTSLFYTDILEEGNITPELETGAKQYLPYTIVHEMLHPMLTYKILPFLKPKGETYCGDKLDVFYFEGTNAMAANAGYPVQFNSGNHLVDGFGGEDVWISHNNMGQYPDPKIYHRLGPVTLGLLKDVGWQLKRNIIYENNSYYTGVVFDDKKKFVGFIGKGEKVGIIYSLDEIKKSPYTLEEYVPHLLKSSTVSNEEIKISPIKILNTPNGIIITGLLSKSNIKIYSITGKLLNSFETNTLETNISIGKGLHIICVNEEIFKVMN